MTKDPQVQSAILEMVRRIVEKFHPEKIILFGSHARGDAGPDSDVDLLVVLQVEGSKRELRVNIRVAIEDIALSKDILVATPDEVLRKSRQVGSVLRSAIKEGEALYERAG